MFGLSDNKGQKPDSADAQYAADQTIEAGGQPASPATTGDVGYGGDFTSAPPATSIAPSVPADAGNLTPDSPSQPAVPPAPVPPPPITLDSPFNSPEPEQEPAKAPPSQPDLPTMTPSSSGDLLQMKQQALQSLAPLIDHLEQTPEEKFKTTMMLIQASDNAELVKEAYDAANQIKDEKMRAQALLDVVNEINYFTHQDQDPHPAEPQA